MVCVGLASAGFAAAQQESSLVSTQPPVLGTVTNQTQAAQTSGCSAIQLQLATELTFKQRACYYGERLVSPGTLLHATMSSAYGQFLNVPHVQHENLNEFGHRFGVYYARRTARDTSEMLAGFLNHEDPRGRVSQEHGFWNRTRSAMLSVLVVKDSDGNARPAVGPIAGAFGSGMVSMVCYQRQNTLQDGLRRTGVSYSAYFGRAVVHEFQPELSGLAARVLHKKR